MWDVRTGQLLTSFAAFRTEKLAAPPEWLAWTPEGFYAGSPGCEKYIAWRSKEKMAPAALHQSRRRPDRVRAALLATK